ncbi:MAG: sulfate reduction electron transfer complex DsrMKJOP subunit DsrM, partial [Desulfobulbaceae bacterium]|nr:sulfate reduction electron transfer complex DsrMKJOP subunit DsrM [Desulfobulbaceae bacterium]
VVYWAKSPVPLSIQTTSGQAKSLDFLKHNKREAPDTNSLVVARMLLEVLTFRSLFRNTQARIYSGPKLTHESSKWLWMFALLFHYSFLIVLIRHMRLFLNPTPVCLDWLEFFDGIFQIGAPNWYITDICLVAGLLLLLLRRFFMTKVRYISLANDYFPLFLLLGIATSGILMRYLLHGNVDVVAIKQLAVGLVTFHPTITAPIASIFYIHLFLVCTLLAYFPHSKLMHMAGVLFSPTRNMRNNTRAVRHINPWNPDIKPHSYAGYEDEFREFMVEAGIPVEKELPASEA